MRKRSQQWKALEREAARELRGKRVHRGADFSESAVDVELEELLAHLKVDGKYRVKHAHHSFLEEVRKKYCGPHDVPILVTKHHRQRGAVVSCPLEFFGLLLDAYRAVLKNELGGSRLHDATVKSEGAR